MVEAEAGEAEAALNALLVLGLLAKVARRQVGRNAAVHSLLTSIGWGVAIGAKRDHNPKLSALAACCEGSESIITLFAGPRSASPTYCGYLAGQMGFDDVQGEIRHVFLYFLVRDFVEIFCLQHLIQLKRA